MLLRDVVLGLLCWTTTFALIIGNICFWMHFFGPPIVDRDRTFAFIAGGAGVMIALILLGSIFTAIYVTWRS